MANENIIKDFDEHATTIVDRIDVVKLRQQEMQNLISTITGANQNLETLLMKEKDPKERGKYYSLISKNTQLLAELHGAFAQYETIINKYVQDVGKTMKDKHHMISIELRMLDEKFNALASNDAATLVLELKNLLKEAGNEKMNKRKKMKLDEDEYSME